MIEIKSKRVRAVVDEQKDQYCCERRQVDDFTH